MDDDVVRDGAVVEVDLGTELRGLVVPIVVDDGDDVDVFGAVGEATVAGVVGAVPRGRLVSFVAAGGAGAGRTAR